MVKMLGFNIMKMVNGQNSGRQYYENGKSKFLLIRERVTNYTNENTSGSEKKLSINLMKAKLLFLEFLSLMATIAIYMVIKH